MVEHIYTLTDPFTNEVRYVGRTNNPSLRLAKHVSLARTGNQSDLSQWVRSVLDNDARPRMDIVETTVGEDGAKIERDLIVALKQRGLPLLNDPQRPQSAMKRDPNRVASPLGEYLLREIDQRGLTIAGLAKCSGIGQSSLWLTIYTPTRIPKLQTFEALARALDTPIGVLINALSDPEAQPA